MKKLIFLSAISFLFFSMTSCYTTKTINSQEKFYKCMKEKNGEYAVNEKIKVLSVISKKGDTIDFSKDKPGIVSEQGVSGFQKFHFPFSAVDSTVFNNTSLQSLWVAGNKYEFISQDELGYVCNPQDSLNIPLAEIEQMQVLKPNLPLTLTAIIVPPIVVFVSIAIYQMNHLNLGY